MPEVFMVFIIVQLILYSVLSLDEAPYLILGFPLLFHIRVTGTGNAGCIAAAVGCFAAVVGNFPFGCFGLTAGTVVFLGAAAGPVRVVPTDGVADSVCATGTGMPYDQGNCGCL